jgi:thiamine biosynthesis lipoprotein
MSRDRVEARFGAMGCEARVVVIGGPARADERARSVVEVLGRKWGRYRSGSEIARINEKAGHAVVVSPETYGLVTRAVGAWRVTGGRYDPTVPASGGPVGVTGPGCARFVCSDRHRSIQVPAGVHLDVTGLARGFAADLAVADLVAHAVGGALVSIGADVRVAGEPPRSEGWLVDVRDPLQPGSLGRLRLRAGAVSTHPVAGSADPHAGVAAVTVVAGEAWWAQALARAAFVVGAEAGVALLAEHGVTGLVVRDTGDIVEAPGLDAFC